MTEIYRHPRLTEFNNPVALLDDIEDLLHPVPEVRTLLSGEISDSDQGGERSLLSTEARAARGLRRSGGFPPDV
jgi:hypothetical protein